MAVTSASVKLLLASLSVKVTTVVWPVAKLVRSALRAMVGAVVSACAVLVGMLTMLVLPTPVSEPSVLKLPAASLNLKLSTLTVLVVVLPALGVKVAV